MLELDGSEGGGQLFRSALSLSALTGTPIEMDGIRGARPEPGLRPQHRAVLESLAEICSATVEGNEVGATTVTFDPDEPTGGHYEVTIETAGSVSLVFDALLPLATAIDRPLVLDATGGTSVAWSPSMPWYRQVKLPFLRERGIHATVDLDRPGFYPTGGGRARLTLSPSSLRELAARDRGQPSGVRIHSTATADLADADVAERQADRAVDRITDEGFETAERTARYVDADSTGSVVLVAIEYENGIVGADALGEPGKPAEDVADDAVDDLLADHGSGGAVDRYFADQLVPWVAITGGAVRIPDATDHVTTHCELLDAFGFDVRIEDDDGVTLVGSS